MGEIPSIRISTRLLQQLAERGMQALRDEKECPLSDIGKGMEMAHS